MANIALVLCLLYIGWDTEDSLYSGFESSEMHMGPRLSATISSALGQSSLQKKAKNKWGSKAKDWSGQRPDDVSLARPLP